LVFGRRSARLSGLLGCFGRQRKLWADYQTIPASFYVIFRA
jgi:hypothetical protein